MAPYSSQMQKKLFSQVEIMPNADTLFTFKINTDIQHSKNNWPMQETADLVRRKKTARWTTIKLASYYKKTNLEFH